MSAAKSPNWIPLLPLSATRSKASRLRLLHAPKGTLGWRPATGRCLAIGSGTFTLENSTVHSRRLINLRNDYGSTWRGDFVIRNSVFIPRNGESYTASLIGGRNTGRHDFEYIRHMPRRITIDTLHIANSQHPEEDYQGPAILADFNPEFTDASNEWTYPYVLTGEVVPRNTLSP